MAASTFKSKQMPESGSPVKLIIVKTIATIYTAREAMAAIGDHWDTSPYGDPAACRYEFELDDHIFEVTVTPKESSVLVTPFDDVPLGA